MNGSQLAKIKKYIPHMSLPWNLWGRSSWSKKIQLYLKNYDFCEYVTFGAISWKIDILQVTAWLKFKSKSSFAYMWHILLWLSATHHISFLLNRFTVEYRFPFPILRLLT